MKITCLIDSLNSGGAQRQLCLLAVELKRKGWNVEIVTYHDFNFFLPLVANEKITLQNIEPGTHLQRILRVRKYLRRSEPDIVLSYLHTPNLLAELAGPPFRNFKVIVSERNTEYGRVRAGTFRRFLFHLLADAVVTNSFSQADFISRIAPWLRSRTATIPNCVDLEKFHPREHLSENPSATIRLLVLGRFEPQKNPFILLAALEILVRSHGVTDVEVDWYGNNFYLDGKATSKSDLFDRLQREIDQKFLSPYFRLHPPEKNVVALYQSATAVCLPSLHEGCSNVICEAMACGRPVLASRVADNTLLVEDGMTGLLFSPHDPEDLAQKILLFQALPAETKQEMGRRSRSKAERDFSPAEFVNRYLELFEGLQKGSSFRSSRSRA
ncbi:MAG: glycosyltransferase family 4 protein [Syntrophotaleaceae bacterium]